MGRIRGPDSLVMLIVYSKLRSVYTAFMNESGSFEWEEVPDLTSFPEEELKAQLEAFSDEEREVSYRRRVIQGRIDLLRAELVRRGGFSVSSEDLVRALLGDVPEGESSRASGPDQESEENPEENRGEGPDEKRGSGGWISDWEMG